MEYSDHQIEKYQTSKRTVQRFLDEEFDILMFEANILEQTTYLLFSICRVEDKIYCNFYYDNTMVNIENFTYEKDDNSWIENILSFYENCELDISFYENDAVIDDISIKEKSFVVEAVNRMKRMHYGEVLKTDEEYYFYDGEKYCYYDLTFDESNEIEPFEMLSGDILPMLKYVYNNQHNVDFLESKGFNVGAKMPPK